MPAQFWSMILALCAAVVLLYGLYCLAQMLRYRSPNADPRAFTGAAHEFTREGLRYRRRFFLAWLVFAVLIAAIALTTPATS